MNELKKSQIYGKLSRTNEALLIGAPMSAVECLRWVVRWANGEGEVELSELAGALVELLKIGRLDVAKEMLFDLFDIVAEIECEDV